jgi:hypothetical protein
MRLDEIPNVVERLKGHAQHAFKKDFSEAVQAITLLAAQNEALSLLLEARKAAVGTLQRNNADLEKRLRASLDERQALLVKLREPLNKAAFRSTHGYGADDGTK